MQVFTTRRELRVASSARHHVGRCPGAHATHQATSLKPGRQGNAPAERDGTGSNRIGRFPCMDLSDVSIDETLGILEEPSNHPKKGSVRPPSGGETHPLEHIDHGAD